MNKKNAYIRTLLILLCITAIPSFYLFPSYLPAGKRPPVYTGPRRIRQKPRTPVAQPEQPQPQRQLPTPVPAPIAIDQSNQNIQQPAVEPTVAADTMQAKAVSSSPGFLMTAYIVLLSTLNKAFGTGIELSYKPLSQNIMQRQAFLNIKNEAQNEATKAVQSGEYAEQIREAITHLENRQTSPEDPQYFQREKAIEKFKKLLNSDQEQISSLTKDILKAQKIDVDKMEKQTSFGSIARQTAYLGLFNTAARLAGGLIGFGATMLLQSLMPTQGE